MISRARTTARTAEKRVVIRPGEGYEGAPSTGTDAVIRHAAAHIGGVPRSSTVLRGHTCVLVAVLGLGEVASDFWFERTGRTGWTLTLGADTTSGVVIDWQVRCAEVPDPAGTALSVVTTQALTTDGALVKGDVHDGLRQLIGDGVAGLGGRDPAAGAAVTRAGYDTPTRQLCGPTPAVFSDDFAVRTPLSVEAALQRLRLVQAPRADLGNDGMALRLGIVGQPGAHAVLTVVDLGPEREVVGHVAFAESGSVVADAVAYRRSTELARSVCDVMRLWGNDARLERRTGEGEDGHAELE
jgi:hypothetical protein